MILPDLPSGGPRWKALASVIEDMIHTGQLQPGDPTPSYRTIHDRYGLAQGTVATALRDLARRGHIRVYPSSGAYVTTSPAPEPQTMEAVLRELAELRARVAQLERIIQERTPR